MKAVTRGQLAAVLPRSVVGHIYWKQNRSQSRTTRVRPPLAQVSAQVLNQLPVLEVHKRDSVVLLVSIIVLPATVQQVTLGRQK